MIRSITCLYDHTHPLMYQHCIHLAYTANKSHHNISHQCRALDAIVSSAEPNHRSGPSSSTQAQLRLLSTMQLAPSQTDSQALLPPRLECLLLPCVPYCTGRDLATLQTHLQRLGLTATPAVRDAQGTRISELLAAAVAAEVAAGEAAEEAMEEAAGAPDCQHNPTSNRAASPTGLEANSGLGRQSTCQSTLVHQDTQPGVEQHYNNNNSSSSNIYLRDVLTMLASFSAAGGAPMSLDHTALRDSLPQLLCQAHGKAVADLLREIAVLKIPVSRVQQVALGRAINRHVQEMGAASMSKVVSALSSCRYIVVVVVVVVFLGVVVFGVCASCWDNPGTLLYVCEDDSLIRPHAHPHTCWPSRIHPLVFPPP